MQSQLKKNEIKSVVEEKRQAAQNPLTAEVIMIIMLIIMLIIILIIILTLINTNTNSRIKEFCSVK